MILQPYLASVEREGEFSGLFYGGVYSHGVRKIPVPGDYRVQDDFGAKDEPTVLSDDARAVCQAALKAIPHNGPLVYARVDLLRAPSGWVLNELEIAEPSLFFRHAPHSATHLVTALLNAV